MTKTKKNTQLGMNESTARNRLSKDILWNFIVITGNNNCCKCGMEMSRETFSIEHIVPWLDHEKPLEMFFDLENISYSHLTCNIKDGRKPVKKYFTDEERNKAKRKYDKFRTYDPEKRKEQYLRHGR